MKEYSRIKDLLPTGKLKDKSLPDNKLFVEEVIYICGWRYLPKEYGKCNIKFVKDLIEGIETKGVLADKGYDANWF